MGVLEAVARGVGFIGRVGCADVEGEGDRDGGGNSASEVSSTSDTGVIGFGFGRFVFFMLARVCSYVRTGIVPWSGNRWVKV